MILKWYPVRTISKGLCGDEGRRSFTGRNVLYNPLEKEPFQKIKLAGKEWLDAAADLYNSC